MSAWVYLGAGAAGLAAGRFLTVLAAAALEGAPVREAVRRLPGGHRPEDWRDFLPAVWWVRNLARRTGGGPVDALFPCLEGAAAVLFIGAVHFAGIGWRLPAYLWFCSVTAVLAFIDFRRHLIPNRILYPGTAAGLALLAGGAALEARLDGLLEASASGLGYCLVLLAMHFLTRGAMGMGDVKFAFLLGFFAGYHRWETAAVAGAAAFLLAGAASALLLVLRRRTRRDHIPFGPFMAVGAWTSISWVLSAAPFP